MKIAKVKNHLQVDAPAKINQVLLVGGRRKDGYHHIRSLFRAVSLFDRLRFTPASSGFSLQSSGYLVPTDRSNLIIRALLALQAELKIKTGLNVFLKKNIPLGAGLGGGSSDAAAALWAGWIFWKKPRLDFPFFPTEVPATLLKVGARLGADIPFFLGCPSACVEGKGEKITPLQGLDRQFLVLVYPRVPVPTKEAYAWLDASRVAAAQFAEAANSFDPVVSSRVKVIAKVRAALRQAGASPVLLSGSGSAVFGIVNNRRQGAAVIKKLKKYPWDSFAAHTL